MPRLKSEKLGTTIIRTRINTKIRCPTGTVAIRDSKDQIVIYNVVGVITHKGGVKNGHYIYNHYVQEERKWLTIDDHRIKFDDVKESNEQGTVFILKKSSPTATPPPAPAFDRLTPESTTSASSKPITDTSTPTLSVSPSEPSTSISESEPSISTPTQTVTPAATLVSVTLLSRSVTESKTLREKPLASQQQKVNSRYIGDSK